MTETETETETEADDRARDEGTLLKRLSETTTRRASSSLTFLDLSSDRRESSAMSRTGVILACLFALSVGCVVEPDRALFDIESVGPERLEPDMRLEVRGEGFPLGRAAEVRLTGALHRPGARPLEVRSTSEGRVDSEGLVVVPITDAWIEAFGGRGTFIGRARVGFSTERDALIFGEHSARFDLLPAMTSQLDQRAESVAEAELLAQQLGLTLSSGDYAESGLEVLDVWPGGPAARAGIEHGDTIVRLGEVRLYSLADFQPPWEPAVAELRVHRPRTGGSFVALANLDPHGASSIHATSRTVLLLILGLLMGVFGPFATLLRHRPLTRGLRSGFARTQRALPRMHFTIILLLAGVLCALAALGTMPKLGWWVTACAFAGVLSWAARRRYGWEVPKVPWTTIAVVLVGMVMVGGTFALESIVERQGVAPWEWWLFKHPAAFLLFFPAVYALSSPIPTGRLGLFASPYRAALAFVLVTLFMGGWVWPTDGIVAMGWLVLAAKLSAIVWLSTSIDVDARFARSLACAGMALAALTFWTGGLDRIASLSSPLLLGAMLGALVHAVVAARAERQPILVARWQL